MIDDQELSLEELAAGFNRLHQKHSISAEHLESARMSWSDRKVRIATTVNNTSDQRVAEITALMQRFSAQPDQVVSLTDKEKELLGLMAIEPPLTAAQLLNKAREQIDKLTREGSPLTAPVLKETEPEHARIADGEYRLRLENQVVAADTVVAMSMLRAIQAHNFEALRATAAGVYSFESMPDWVRQALRQALAQIDLNVETNLVAIEQLNDWVPGVGKSTIIRPLSDAAQQDAFAMALIIDESNRKLQEIRKAREVEQAARLKEEAARRKRETHERRDGQLEKVAFQAARALGVQQFTEAAGVVKFPILDEKVPVADEDPFTVPFYGMQNSDMLRVSAHEVMGSGPLPLHVLTRFGIMRENSVVFTQVVETVSQGIMSDWTGYSRDDYASEEEWKAQWRRVLPHIALGYAVGALEGSLTATDEAITKAAHSVASGVDVPVYRAAVAQQALSVLFGDKNFLEAIQGKSLPVIEVPAASQIYRWMQGQGISTDGQQRLNAMLEKPDTFKNYQQASVTRQEKTKEALSRDDRLLENAKGEYQPKLDEAHTHIKRLEELYRTRVAPAEAYLNAVAELQKNPPPADAVVDFNDGKLSVKASPRLRVAKELAGPFVKKVGEVLPRINKSIYKKPKTLGMFQNYALPNFDLSPFALQLEVHQAELGREAIDRKKAQIQDYYGDGPHALKGIERKIDEIKGKIGQAETGTKAELAKAYRDQALQFPRINEILGNLVGTVGQFIESDLYAPKFIDFAVYNFVNGNLRTYLEDHRVSIHQ